jgi:hypothetical protein
LRIVKKRNREASQKQTGRYCIVHYSRCADRCLKPLSERAFNTIQCSRDIRMKSLNRHHQQADICNNIPLTYDEDRHAVHNFCYKSFTNTTHVKVAMSKSQVTDSATNSLPRRCDKRSPSTGELALFPQNKCLFCDKGPTNKHGKFVRLSRCETFDGAQKIIDAATEKRDFRLLGKISGST